MCSRSFQESRFKMSQGKVLPLKKESVAAKVCKVCGEMIAFTRRTARDWEKIQYCSAVCRRTGVSHQRMAEAS
jgi:hypothetical protein